MGNLRLALLVVCLGGLCMVTEAGRFHNFFAASTHYLSKTDTPTETPPRYPNGYPDQVAGKYVLKDSEDATAVETPGERYPDGYPDQVAGKYVLKKETKNATESEAGVRYLHGYYNESGWDNPSKTDTVAVEKSYKSTYTSVPKDAAGLFDRYPNGYPPSSPATYTGPSLGLAKTDDDWHRYEDGYFGKAGNYLQGTDKQSTVLPGDAYYPQNHRTSSVSYTTSRTGNFNTMPYTAAGTPYVASGAGCRTSYWAKDAALWPAFFTAKSTVGDAFGTKAGEVYGDKTILQSLLSYTTDPYSQLSKSGCTALLNSLTRGAYPLSHIKVIEKFIAGLISKEAASATALEFEKYNVESISKGDMCN